MRRRLLILTVLALVLLPVVLASAVLYTEWGTSLAAAQLWRLERYGVHIEGVSGRLAGPLYVERFELDHPRVQVEAHDIVVDTQLRGLLLQTIQAKSLTLRDALVVLRDVDLPSSGRPPRILPRWMRIDARGVDIQGARYVHTNGMEIAAERVRGRATLSSRRLRIREARVDAERFGAAGDMELIAGRPFGLRANATGHVLSTRDVPLAATVALDGTLDRLVMQGQLTAPSAATVDAVMTRPEDNWHIVGRINAESYDLQPWLANPPFDLRDVTLEAKANAEGIEIAGTLGIPQLSPHDLTLAARGRFTARVLEIDSADMTLEESPATLHTSGTIAFDGGEPALDLNGTWRGLQWPLHGDARIRSPSGTAKVRGAHPYDFDVAAKLEGEDFPDGEGNARGVLSQERLLVSSYEINALGGSLIGEASLDFDEARAWRFTTHAEGIDPKALHPQFPGRVDLRARASGRGLGKAASFNLALTELKGQLRGETVRASGTVARNGKRWQADDVTVVFSDARLALDGTLRDTLDVRFSFDAPALDRLLPDAGGRLALAGSASGAIATPRLVLDVEARNLRYGGWAARELTIDADVDVTGAQPSQLSLIAHDLGRGDPWISTLRVTGAGEPLDHRVEVAVRGVASGAQAAPEAAMQVVGRYENRGWHATVATKDLSTGNERRQLGAAEPARVAVTRERALLEDLCFLIGAGRICAQGEWQRGGAWQGTVAGYEIPLAALLPPTGETAEFAGRVEGRVHASGAPGQAWQGDAGMRIIDAAIIYRPAGAEPEVLNLGTGGLGARATAERIDFSFGIQAFTDTFLYASAHLLRDGSNDVLHLPLSGDVRARAADANILPLVFPEIDRAAGLLTASATVGGTLARPELNGRIELANGEFDSYHVNLALREITLVADLERTGLDFRGAALAGEGRLQTDGSFTWRDGVSSGSFRLRGEELLVADLPEYRVVASPDLRFRIDGTRIAVAGDVRIPSARVQPAQLTGAVRASDDARYVGEHPAEKAGRFTVHSEVRVDMGADVRIDAFGLQGRIVGGVGTTVETGEAPIGRGELSVEDGRYEAYGQKLEINRGRLLFDVSPLDDPALDIEARRRIEPVTVGLNVRGTLQAPRLTFFSDPSMPQTQIVSYLLTGNSMDSATAADTTTVSAARDSLALQGGGVLASQIGRRLGIEELGVESSINSAGESNTALVLGKFLSPRLFISYGISLTESINTLKLRYTLSDKWIFRTEAGEEQSADLEYTIER